MDGQSLGGNGGVLTPKELVRLAEYCGHRAFIWSNRVWLGEASQAKDEHMVHWRPHLDANQRDELVEALRVADHQVYMNAYRDRDYTNGPYSCIVDWWDLSREPYVKKQLAYEWGKTPGLAVCRAALKVIGEQNAD